MTESPAMSILPKQKRSHPVLQISLALSVGLMGGGCRDGARVVSEGMFTKLTEHVIYPMHGYLW